MRPYFLFASLLLPCLISAQSLVFTLLNDQQQPVEGAMVSLLRSSDTTLLHTELTDPAGRVVFDSLPTTPYLINIQALGFTTSWWQPENLPANNRIYLSPVAAELSTVTVTADRKMFELRPEGIAVNVANTALAVGQSALEILRKSPGVVIDQNNDISLRGKNGVRVYIDGKPSPLTGADLSAYLQGLQAGEIDLIELITSPSARYDAAGNAGIINIRLKKDKNMGTNGSLSAGINRGRNTQSAQNISLNHRNKQLNLFGSYGINYGKNWSFFDFYREQSGYVYDQKAQTIRSGPNQNYKAGADWFIHKNHTLGISLTGGNNDLSSITQTRTPIYPVNSREVEQLLLAGSNRQSNRNNLSSNLNYLWEPKKKGQSLNVDLNYGLYDLLVEERVPNYYVNPYQPDENISELIFFTQTPTEVRLGSLKADWEMDWLQGKLSLGGKSNLVRTHNIFNFYDVIGGANQLDDQRSNEFTYTENIQALYAQWKYEKDKWNVQFGLRAEHTASRGDLETIADAEDKEVSRSYLDWFPSAGIAYQMHPNHRLQLNYSRRIDRPIYADLNPFEYRLNELTYGKGNPFLLPQYTHNIEISHAYKWTLNTSLSYSHVSNYFANVSDTIEQKRSFIRRENFDYQQVWALSVSYPYTLTKWWSGFATITAAHAAFRADFGQGKTISIDNRSLSTYANAQFKLPRNWSVEFGGSYSTPSVWGGTYETRPFWFVDAGFQKKWNRLTAKVNISDIFLSMRWWGVAEFGGLYAIATGGWDSRQIRFNLSYQFGSSTVKRARQRNGGLEELQKRAE